MSQPAAKEGDLISGTDSHNEKVPSQTGTIIQSFDVPFSGPIDGGLSSDVKINGHFAATVGSTAKNSTPHIAIAPGISFVLNPSNSGEVTTGSDKVKINNKKVARNKDNATTCNDSGQKNNSSITASGTVLIG